MTNILNYNINTDITAKKLNENKLKETINNDINIPIHCIDVQRTSLLTFSLTFKSDIDSYISNINTIVLNHDGKPLEIKTQANVTEKGYMQVEVNKPSFQKQNIFTHDWCKKETWYQNSIRVTNEQLVHVSGSNYTEYAIPFTEKVLNIWDNVTTSVNVGDLIIPNNSDNKYYYECIEANGLKTKSLAEPEWIRYKDLVTDDNLLKWKAKERLTVVNVTDSLITNEYYLRPLYAPKVYVNGVLKTQNSAYSLMLYNESILSDSIKSKYLDGDYTFNYNTNSIKFNNPLTVSDNVTMDYSKVTNSKFTIEPPTNKLLILEYIEGQFCDDFRMKDDFIFTLFINEIAQPSIVYESMKNFIDETNRSFPTIPATLLNENENFNYKDLKKPCRPFTWDYLGTTDLYHNLNMKLEIKLLRDQPCYGEYATATAYCGLKDL